MTIKFPTANEIRNSMPTQEELEAQEMEVVNSIMMYTVVPLIRQCAKENKSYMVFSSDYIKDYVDKCISLLRTLGYTVEIVDGDVKVSW